jgi:hypothetical protein
MEGNYVVISLNLSFLYIVLTWGYSIVGLGAETATFIAECGEDENDLVIIAASKLKDAVEAVAGKIDGL